MPKQHEQVQGKQASSKKRLAAIIACCAVAIVVLASAGVWAFLKFKPQESVDPEPENDVPAVVESVVVPSAAVAISPVAADSNNCIPTEPEFLIALSEPMEQKVLAEWLKVTPELDFSLKKTKNELEYQLVPEGELQPNTLYTFTFDPLQESGGMPARAGNTWTFQTQKRFAVERTLPEESGMYVPVDSVIELVFGGDVKLEELKKNVSFQPALKGSDWRKTGMNTYAFLPDGGMAYNTVYEVRVKGALADAMGKETLGKDFTFKFRTNEAHGNGYAYAQYDNNAYMSTERPAFSLRTSDEIDGTVTAKVFRYENVEQYRKTAEAQLDDDPWGMSAIPKRSTAGLAKVLEQELEIYTGDWTSSGVVVLPDTLPKGFYAAEFSFDTRSVITYFQVTDLSAYAMSGGGDCLFWVNDLTTSKPVSGAEVFVASGASKGKTAADGVVSFQHAQEAGRTAFLVQKGGDQLLVMLDNSAAPEDFSAADYWRYVYADKELYRPDDTLNFFGIVSPKIKGTKALDKVTMKITRYGMGEDSQITAEAALKDGVFEGQIKLPELAPGEYSLEVYSGEKELGRTYFTVDIYQKPAFSLTLSADKYVAWAGDKATVTATAEYFDGTPVAELGLTLWGDPMTTDADGKASVQVEIDTGESERLTGYSYYSASAEFPEIGDVSKYLYISYFNSNVEVKASAKRNGKACDLELQAFNVDFSGQDIDENSVYDTDRFLKDFSGKLALDVTWTEITYKKVPTGKKEYDPYTKTFTESYRYEREEKRGGSKKFTVDGKEKQNFTLPISNPEGNYRIDIMGKDTKGRAFERIAYYYELGRQSDDYRRWVNVLDLDGKSKYAIGDDVTLALCESGSETPQPIEEGTALFIRASNRLMDHTVAADNLLRFQFDDKVLPNINVYGVLFDGREYVTPGNYFYYAHRTVSIDAESRALSLEIKPDKNSYKPGETAKLSLQLTDAEQNPVQGVVNLNMVDEALLALQEQYVDIGERIFGDWYHLGFSSVISHIIVRYDSGEEGGGGEGGGERSDFRDTALFKTVQTDKNGRASVEVKLPDNITSWRVFWQAFSPDDVMAGSGRENIIATLPFFVDHRLADAFLTGDKPILGVRSAGIALNGGEVKYTVNVPSMKFSKMANAPVSAWFEVPLPSLTAGKHSVSVAADYKEHSDAVKKEFDVTDSIADHAETSTEKLTESTKFDVPAKGMVQVVFTDKQKAQVMQAVGGLAYQRTIRAEQVAAKMIAQEVLSGFSDGRGVPAELAEQLAVYQKSNGSMAPFSYAEADEDQTLETTVWVSAAAGDQINKAAAARYFYNAMRNFESKGDMKQASLVLAGLAALKEPVMPYISEFMQEELSAEQTINLALANIFIGNGAAAKALAESVIKEHGKPTGEMMSVNGGSREDSLRMTAGLAAAATLLDMPEGEKLFQYVLDNKGVEDLYLLQQALVLRHKAQSVNPECAEFTYTLEGKATKAKLFTSRSMLVTAEQLRAMTFSGLSDEIEASVLYTAKGFPQESSNQVGVAQSYAGELQANRAAAGRIGYSISADAPDGYYNIVHVLPAGLSFSGLDWKFEHKNVWVSEIKGQQVTFTVWKEKTAVEGSIRFNARPVMTGTFKSEGTYIIHQTAPEITNKIDGGTVVIK